MAMSLAFGLLMVGALNLISVAFFALFVGIGVDFGIQFSVRYRAERHELRDLRDALISAARKAGAPLALAAAATAVGFSSFVPTAYRGLAELGQIAGSGMIIAFLTHYASAGAALGLEAACRGAPDGHCCARAGGPVYRTAPATGNRDHDPRSRACLAAGCLPAIRFQPAASAQSKSRIGGDVP
jgi:predicted exporter